MPCQCHTHTYARTSSTPLLLISPSSLSPAPWALLRLRIYCSLEVSLRSSCVCRMCRLTPQSSALLLPLPLSLCLLMHAHFKVRHTSPPPLAGLPFLRLHKQFIFNANIFLDFFNVHLHTHTEREREREQQQVPAATLAAAAAATLARSKVKINWGTSCKCLHIITNIVS